MRQRDVAEQQDGRPARGGADAERGRDRPVDPVRAAVGEHAERRLADGEERLDVAHRHRGGDDERRLGRQQRAELGGDARLVEPGRPDRRARSPAPPRGRRRARRRASSCPCACAAASWPARRASCAGRRRRSSPTAPAGSCQARLGVEADLQRVEPRQPRAQRLGGRQVADAQHEVRARARPAPRRAAARRSGRSPPGRGGRRTAARPAAGSRRARRRRRAAAASRGSRSERPATTIAFGRAASSSVEPVQQPRRGLAQRPRPRHPRPPAVAAGRELDVRHAVAVGHERLAEGEVQVHRAGAAVDARSRTRGRRAGAASAPAPG